MNPRHFGTKIFSSFAAFPKAVESLNKEEKKKKCRTPCNVFLAACFQCIDGFDGFFEQETVKLFDLQFIRTLKETDEKLFALTLHQFSKHS